MIEWFRRFATTRPGQMPAALLLRGAVTLILLIAAACAGAPVETRVHFEPTGTAINIGATTVVNIRVDGVSNLWGVGLRLAFDPSIVACVQSEAGKTPAPQIVAKNACSGDNFEYIATQQAPSVPSSGNGDIVRLTFRCLSPGTSPLRFESLKLVDRDGLSLTNKSGEGSISCARN